MFAVLKTFYLSNFLVKEIPCECKFTFKLYQLVIYSNFFMNVSDHLGVIILYFCDFCAIQLLWHHFLFSFADGKSFLKMVQYKLELYTGSLAGWTVAGRGWCVGSISEYTGWDVWSGGPPSPSPHHQCIGGHQRTPGSIGGDLIKRGAAHYTAPAHCQYHHFPFRYSNIDWK